jgi:hypothetical protein
MTGEPLTLPSLGFVIMSHQRGRQLERLVRAINQLYDNPPIACHHDFSQAELDVTGFPSHVQFVQPSRRTAWGRMLTVEAALDALQLLYADGGPDWFVLLGLSDYPIMPAAAVLNDLARSEFDALLDYRLVGQPDAEVVHAANPAIRQFDNEASKREAARWYLAAQMWLPVPKPKNGGGWRVGRRTWLLPVNYPFSPFNEAFRCYRGSHWFTGSSRTADVLINPTKRHLALRRHFARRSVPEESYYQSVLVNAGLKIDRHNRRFEEWNGGGSHPQWLTSAELDAMFASGCHFARKFRPDDPVLDRIDEALGISAKVG